MLTPPRMFCAAPFNVTLPSESTEKLAVLMPARLTYVFAILAPFWSFVALFAVFALAAEPVIFTPKDEPQATGTPFWKKTGWLVLPAFELSLSAASAFFATPTGMEPSITLWNDSSET